jgi:hypothetical protein
LTLLRPQRGGKRPTPGQRLARKALEGFDPESLEPGWRSLSAHYTEDARARASEPGISVIAGPGRALDAPGVWIPSVMRIGLDGAVLPVNPENLDLMFGEHFRALATLHGVYIHEVGHAVHTPRDSREDMADHVHDAWALLEEIRMEARVCDDDPDNARWLRTSARRLILDEVRTEGIGDPCGLSVLLDGRVMAGSLFSTDVPDAVRAAIDAGVGDHRRSELADIIFEATKIPDSDALAAPMLSLSERLAALREEDVGSTTIITLTEAEFEKALEQAELDGASDLEGLGASKDLDVMVIAVREDVGASSDRGPSVDTTGSLNSRGMSQRGRGIGAASGRRVRMGTRNPTAEEEKARQLLTGVLRRIFLPERQRQRRNRERPGGRLRAREALRADADRAQGRMTNARPWAQRVHVTGPTTKIDVGILIDTSGSMSGTETSVAGASWIVASAVEALGGYACVAGFGDSAQLLIKPGSVGRHVPVYSVAGGTAHVERAAMLALEELAQAHRRREWGSDATLLVILSDGGWSETVSDFRDELAKRGGQILLVGIDYEPSRQDVDLIDFVNDIAEIPEVIGGSMVALKGHARTLTA